MDYFIPSRTAANAASTVFHNATLILPQPSLGSLPQLALDLLVTTCHFKLIGHLHPRDYIPSVGGLDSPDQQGVSFGPQVFANQDETLIVVLPRSPVIRARKDHHLVAMRAFIEAAHFTNVLLIAGVDAGTRGDESLQSNTPLRHFILTPNHSTPLTTRLTSALPAYAPHLPAASSSSRTPSIPFMPHAGITRRFLEALSTPSIIQGVAVSTLLIYASEGDNIASAYFLATALVEALKLPVDKKSNGELGWIEPTSWELGLTGGALGRERGGELFG